VVGCFQTVLDLCQIAASSVLYLGQHNVGDDTGAMNPVEKMQQAKNYLLAVSRLAASQASQTLVSR
jgi:hypothetical protein